MSNETAVMVADPGDEEGAAAEQQNMFEASGATEMPSDENLSAAANDMGIDAEAAKMFANNDPAFRDLVNKTHGGQKDNKGGEEDHAADKPAEDSPAGDEGKESETKTEDKDSGQKAEDEKLEFADNVIEGLSGADFGKLPKNVQLAIAGYFDKTKADVETKTADAEKFRSQLDGLLRDPVVQSRKSVLDAGRGDVVMRGLSQTEKSEILDRINKVIGVELSADMLDDDTAKKLMAEVETGIENIARSMAQEFAGETVKIAEDNKRRVDAAKTGAETLMALGKFNKELDVKDKNLDNYYTRDRDGRFRYNEKHPEIEKFKNGIGKISAWAHSKGIDFAKMLELGDKAFYAAAAADLGFSVALNTEKRDQKIVADAVKKKLAPFLKANSTGTLNVDGGNAGQNRNAEPITLVHGFNAIKLATDEKYLHEMCEKYSGDGAKLELLFAAASEGRSIIEKRKKQ